MAIPRMSLRHIEAFRAVMMTGSMTAAARRVHTSQPHVSRLIAQLEAITQFPLFDRNGSRLTPTQDGSRFFQEVEKTFIGLAGLESAAASIRSFSASRLSVAAMPRLAGGRHLLAWAMQRTGALDLATRWMATNRAALTWSLKSLIRDPAQRNPELIAEIISAARHPGFAAFEQWQHDEMLWNRLKTDYTAQLASLPCPTLIIHGDRDAGVPIARARAAAALIPHAELKVVAGAGHWVQRDQPDVVIAAMLDFLRRLPPP